MITALGGLSKHIKQATIEVITLTDFYHFIIQNFIKKNCKKFLKLQPTFILNRIEILNQLF